MKIDASGINLAGSHSTSVRIEARETLHAWVGDHRPDFEARERSGNAASDVVLSSDAMQAFHASLLSTGAEPAATATAAAVSEAQGSDAAADAQDAAGRDPRLRLLKLIIEMLTGTKIRILSATDLQTVDDRAVNDVPQKAPTQAPAQPAARAGYGIEYDRHERREESEQTHFNAQGVVRTTDGKEIRFDLTLDMQRSRIEEANLSLRAGDAVRKDPLVVNFDGTAAQLQNVRFSFDIDGDGVKESVPLLAGNRGYLALDLDGNGKIDSGRELFGAASGNGFADLAHYDSDGNGWIDESDPVFDRLQLWSPTANGSGALTPLKSHGIGALYLGSAQTPFALKDATNADLGTVRRSGVYLREDGSAGSLQQVDVTV